MNVVFIVPTGIGAEIGGHAGDATPAVRLLAAVSDRLITHPNAVNASDINEMPENALYVEGSILDRFLQGEIELQPVHYNKVLLAVNPPLDKNTVNAASAARASMGGDVEIVVLDTPLRMVATRENGRATGMVEGWEKLVEQVIRYDFDALAITTFIEVSEEVALDYFNNGGVNPWGGVEAKASRLIATALNKPVAHAPYDNTSLMAYKEIVDPRMAAELFSTCFLHCVLKGLHRAPRIGRGLDVRDVDFLVTPAGCFGTPHRACLSQGIPVIAVKENRTCLNDPMPDKFIQVENYLEAAGIVAAFRAGIHWPTVRRPLAQTLIHRSPHA